MYENTPSPAEITRWVAKAILGCILVFLILYTFFRVVGPQMNLYKANTEKRARVAESKSKAEAAVFDAQAEIERAKGAAEANRIIADSINENYIRYLYIQAIEGNPNQIIYIPTEAGLPVLEAGRFNPTIEGEG